MINSASFTATSNNGLERELKTLCTVSSPYNPNKLSEEEVKNVLKGQYMALWDTGASASVITKKVADELGLKPTGIAQVFHADGISIVHKYLVNIKLPNNVGFGFVEVTEGKLTGMDVLIGMDIITRGDFTITNTNNKTVFSFRIPSLEKIDFVEQDEKKRKGDFLVNNAKLTNKKIERNEPCPCGSGKKYKHCHGK